MGLRQTNYFFFYTLDNISGDDDDDDDEDDGYGAADDEEIRQRLVKINSKVCIELTNFCQSSFRCIKYM